MAYSLTLLRKPGEEGRARRRGREEGAGGRRRLCWAPRARCPPGSAVSAGGGPGSSPVPVRGLQLPALRGAARRRPRGRARLSREPSSPAGRSMNGSVAGGGYAEETISLTRRASGRAGRPLPAGAAEPPGPRPAQPRGGRGGGAAVTRGGPRGDRGGHRGGGGGSRRPG